MRRKGWGLFRFAVLAAVLILGGGCRVDATVEARVSGSGGEVVARFVLDREAVALVGGAVGDGTVQQSDLEEAGWEITPIRRTGDGGAQVEARKGFSRASDLAVVIGELAGPAGPLREFRLDRRRTFTRKTYRLRGTADLARDAAAATGFANTTDLPARLRDAGVDPDRVEELLEDRALEGFHLRLVVALPGRAAETLEIHPEAPTTVDIASGVSDRRRPVLLMVTLVSALIVVFRLRRRTSQT